MTNLRENLLLDILLLGSGIYVVVTPTMLVNGDFSEHTILRTILVLSSKDFVNAAYPILGLVYGTFLAFTIVITWGQFNDAQNSVTSEVTYLSDVWRDAETFPKHVCKNIHTNLTLYVE